MSIDQERPIIVDRQGGVALVTLNRPDKRNAMSDDLRTEFIQVLESLGGDRSVRAVVLTGAGKGFCAGGDISGMRQRMEAPKGEIAFNGWHRQQRVHHAQSLLHTMPKPVIAAVNGAASGLGADTASYAIGIVDRLADAEQLIEAAIAWAAELSKGSGAALALSKTIINQCFESSAEQIFAQGSQAQGICYTSTEHRESVMAFLQGDRS